MSKSHIKINVKLYLFPSIIRERNGKIGGEKGRDIASPKCMHKLQIMSKI